MPRAFNAAMALRSSEMIRFLWDLLMVFQEALSLGSNDAARLGLRRSARDAHRFGGDGGGGDDGDDIMQDGHY